MFFGLILIALGLLIAYLILDFILVMDGNLNKYLEKWLNKSVWLWLPFYGLWRLTKEVILKKK